MNYRKISTILIITVVAFFILAIVFYDKNKDGIAKLIDVTLGLSLWSYAFSYLPLEKKRRPYIKTAIIVSSLALIIFILVISGFDFYFGKSV